MSEQRAHLVGWLLATLGTTDLYDDEGILRLTREIDREPFEIPDRTPTGAAAMIADRFLGSAWLALHDLEIAAGVVKELREQDIAPWHVIEWLEERYDCAPEQAPHSSETERQ